MRGEPAFFTHGRVMMWAAFNEGLRAVHEHGQIRDGVAEADGWPDVEDQSASEATHQGADTAILATPEEIRRWSELRDRLHDEIMTEGWNDQLGTFTQTYAPGHGSQEVDASLLQLPSLGFVDWEDERMVRTAQRIVEELGTGSGLLRRYQNISAPPGSDPAEFESQIGQDGFEGPDSPHFGVTLWLAAYQARSSQLEEARRTLAGVLRRATDLGLLATAYDGDPDHGGRMLGNMPHVSSHLSLIEALAALDEAELSARTAAAARVLGGIYDAFPRTVRLVEEYELLRRSVYSRTTTARRY